MAYETRKGVTPGAVGHALRVVRFEPKRGIYLAGEVMLLDFQVYQLICSEGRIEISGWRDVLTKYVVEIASGRSPLAGCGKNPPADYVGFLPSASNAS
jgi:hypothetical protein